jgi:RNA polymerase sigma-70 factor, ECF subfamily
MKKNSLQEKYLVYKVRQHKDAESYGQLYDYYVDRIFRFIFFKVASQEEAEDLTSEVFLKTWEYINNTSRKIENFNALIYRVARNCVIDHYRTRRSDISQTDEDQMVQIQDKRNLEIDVTQKLEIKNIESSLAKLKEDYREVIILRYIEEFSFTEISDIMGKKKANVRVLLHRALQAVKEITEE